MGVTRFAFAGLPLVLAFVAGCGARSTLTCFVDGCDDPFASGDAGVDGSVTEPDTGPGFEFDTAIDTKPGIDPGPSDAAPATTCPPVLPKAGGGCAAPLTCQYVGCDLAKKDVATCVGGKWSIDAAACVSGPDRCPLAIPTSGDACTLADHTGCIWSTECVANVVGWCIGGRWTLKPGSCAHARECPATMPSLGAACFKSTGGSCMYLNECGIPQPADCVDGVWVTFPAACTLDPECPATEPPNGSACTPGARPMCVWKNDCGGVNYGKCGWMLGEGKWTIFHPPCPAPSCPESPPKDPACTRDGLECTYPEGRGCTLECTCRDKSWKCENGCG